MSDRFFVDQRIGCIAVRDRTLTDPEYRGLHYDTPGVVWYEHGKLSDVIKCETCGHDLPRGFELHSGARERADAECARLNAQAGTVVTP